MGRYIIRRIIYFFPTIIFIALISFILSTQAPGDEVAVQIFRQQLENKITVKDVDKKYRLWRQERHLDLPVFYFRLASYAEPDTIIHSNVYFEAKVLRRLLFSYGNWEYIQAYGQEIQRVSYILYHHFPNTPHHSLKSLLNGLRNVTSESQQAYFMDQLAIIAQDSTLPTSLTLALTQLIFRYNIIKTYRTSWKLFIPVIHWHGSKNQFHFWFKDLILKGEWGTSTYGNQDVGKRIKEHLFWTIIMSLSAFILSLAISIPLGIWSALNHHSRIDRTSGLILYVLDGIPNFWMASILLSLFANPDILYWFPASFQTRLVPSEGQSLWALFLEHLPHLVLPLIAYTYGSLAILSRTMRSSMLEEISKDYIRTAKAKGLSSFQIWYKHALKNAILPIITFSAALFPSLLSGSVILETIFSIPGLGRVTWEAIQSEDQYLIVALFTLTGMMTIMGYIITDILYAWLNPRIRSEFSRS